jgi:hypothetical protein
MFDARPPAAIGRPGYSGAVVQVAFAPPGPGAKEPAVAVLKPWGWRKPRPEAEIRRTRTGYVLKAKFPWEFFAMKAPKRSAAMGFDVALVSHNRSGKQNVQMFWTGSAKNLATPETFGSLLFVPRRG